MRYQLRVHLFTLFGGFFLAFFLFLSLYAKYFYQAAVVSNLSTEWPGILQDRLIYSSESVSTAFYFADKALIDSVDRFKELYIEAKKEPFPIRDGAYPSVTPDMVADGQVVYGLSAFCNFDDEDDSRKLILDRLHIYLE